MATGTIRQNYDCYEVGDTENFGGARLALAGYITTSTKICYFDVVTQKSMRNISTVTLTNFTGGVRGISGYVDGSGDSTDWLSYGSITGSAIKVDNRTVRIAIEKSSAMGNVSNNTPVGAGVYVTLSFS